MCREEVRNAVHHLLNVGFGVFSELTVVGPIADVDPDIYFLLDESVVYGGVSALLVQGSQVSLAFSFTLLLAAILRNPSSRTAPAREAAGSL